MGSNTGVILVGHGSKLSQSREIYEKIAKKAKEKCGMDFRVGYIKHWHPTLEESINSMVREGKKKIVVVPVFLLPGMHVTSIPAIINEINSAHNVEIIYAKHLGVDDRLVDVVIDRVKEVLNGKRGNRKKKPRNNRK
jgi:sirohydrochlorin ferrochelatase